MRGSKPLGCVHHVSAAEAAYANLYGHFHVAQIDAAWGPVWPVIYPPWPLRLRSLYAEVCDLNSLPKHGIPVWLYALWRPTDALGLVSVVQGYRDKAQWHGDLPCEHGLGVMVRLGSVVAGDIITIGGVYEPI